MTDEELMNDYVEKNQSYLNAPWGTYKGVQDVPQLSCTPSSHNYVLVFGYDRGITTKPVVVRFDTPAGGDASKTTFDYEPALASPYQIEVNVIPSDLTVPYISVLVLDDEFDKEKYISLIEMQVQNDFQMNAMWNPGMTMTSFLYSNSTYRPGKKSAGVYQDLKEGDSYTICSFAFAPDGKIAAVEEQKSVITVPGLSNASVSGEILGFYDGDEENGLVFGLPDKTKGRVILAMKYTKSAEAKNAWFSITLDSEEIDEMNPEEYIQEDLQTLIKELHSNIPQLSYINVDDIKNLRFARIYDSLRDAAQKAYKEHEEEIIGFYNTISEQYDPSFTKQELFSENNIMRSLERDILLRVVDNQWIDHLHNIDMLKDGIGLRAYGQKDPLIEYKKEAYDLFNKMMYEIQSNTVRYLFRAKFGIQFVGDDGVETIEQ